MRNSPSNDSGSADAGKQILYGTVAEVDAVAGRVVVDMGDIRTAPIRWLERRAGATRTRSVPTVGEQALIFFAGGDIEGAIALVGVTSNAFSLPGSCAAELVEFVDGAILSYDPDAHALTARLPEGATAEIAATGGVTLIVNGGKLIVRGDIEVEGDVFATGTFIGRTDVVGGGKSLKGHKHLGVATGGGVSGLPQ